MKNYTKEVENLVLGDGKMPKERKISVTYTLKRFKETIKTLNEAKMLTAEEKVILAGIYNEINIREIGAKLEL